jgi:DNA-binding SARP family transcriptional activator
VVGGVERGVETDLSPQPLQGPSIEVRMLGPLTIARDSVALALPASRKVRALFAYLVLAPHAVLRSQLCELLWDVPSDPRGELRWCLSKIRALLDGPGLARIDTRADSIALHLEDCWIDAVEVAQTVREGCLDTVELERLVALVDSFRGDFLEGLEIDRCPTFNGWLTAQRRRFRGLHAALLEHLSNNVPNGNDLPYLERWVELAPFDQRAHEALLSALGHRGLVRECEEHLAAATRLFEAEGLDITPLRTAWQMARVQGAASSPARATFVSSPPSAIAPGPSGAVASRRGSVAVMPFVDGSPVAGGRGGMADALAHDVITRLAKLRSLFVIGHGSVFALNERGVDPAEAGRMLNVDYVVSGLVRCQGKRIFVTAELADARTAGIVWAETFNRAIDDAFLILDEIGNHIVASIASEIETIERNRAILKPPNSLDAWEAHHRALWHMYKFNKADNERAQHLFKTAVRLDPTFARAYAGLSFTHFQNAFQGWEPREPEIAQAFEAAGQSVMADERDPAAHWAMGRALWLLGRQDDSYGELELSVSLSPNYVQGHYTLAFVHSQTGDPETAIAAADQSRNLSPFDPMLFGMLGARAMALVRQGRFDEAAEWGVKAAARPNAHAHIEAIAALSLALAGRLDEARIHLAAIHSTLPRYRVSDFLTAMQFAPESERLFREGARRIGID